ncbi:MAG TPA: glutathione S-transferase family protein [Rhizomicrobium sp.]|jgi:glutathione S-transferase|nr:glutathione S-transferase family protein [Rhizomicrobium sp.]
MESIFHHYPSSPFSEKVRVAFGIKGLAWRSVEQPVIMPKPDLIPLTGGYRKIPVMQIGADVFCDTQIILRELERRYPTPSIFPVKNGLAYGLGFWSDRLFFMPSVGVVFGEIGPMVPEAFKEDRAKMSSSTFSTEAMQAAAPFAKDQWRAHADFVAETLEDGRDYMGGAKPGAADIHAYMNFWWLKAAVPHVAAAMLMEFPRIDAWTARVATLGHGTPTPMDPKEALAIAKEATSEAKTAEDPFDPRGLKPGAKVKVSADDYGRDPIAGEIVFTNAHEIAIRRSDPAVGDVVVHFPRAGFNVAPD